MGSISLLLFLTSCHTTKQCMVCLITVYRTFRRRKVCTIYSSRNSKDQKDTSLFQNSLCKFLVKLQNYKKIKRNLKYLKANLNKTLFIFNHEYPRYRYHKRRYISYNINMHDTLGKQNSKIFIQRLNR